MRFLLPRSWWSIALWSGGALAALLAFGVWIGFRAGYVQRIYTYREGGAVRELEGISRVRTVSWSLPREVTEPDPGAAPVPGAIAPATDGRSAAAVLIAARTEDGGRDIFLQELTAAGWTEAVRLQGEINSEADEDSPVLANSGDIVYFASNRPGGHGGWDLYSSRREGDGWQKPSNLGPRVNSPYDDRTPAIDPSGRLLVFSTNRPRSFILSPPVEWSDVPLSAWKPGDEELAFTTQVETEGGKTRWSEVDLVLEAVSGADERDPAFAPGGDFLYFASNRAGGLGGYDLYRASCEVILGGGGPDAEARLVLGPPENLGKPLNSIHDEGDPLLFLNGFAIVYTASDSRGDVEVRFESRTCEVDPEISIGSVPLGVFAENLARITLLVLLGALFAFLVVLSIRYRRMWRFSLMLRCVAVAVMAHAAMLYGFYFWVVST
ncbi:MAG TPA: hypothetical protein VMT52_12665, partial [Planctomycetota bacterium]|nr:hypothetical protein [Planctomycetota bacterium]